MTKGDFILEKLYFSIIVRDYQADT
jgi:hypothetical protein